mgnify:CR=1 FL=1
MQELKLLNFKIDDNLIIINGVRNLMEAEYYLFKDYVYIKIPETILRNFNRKGYYQRYHYFKSYNDDVDDIIRSVIYSKGILGDDADKYIIDNTKYLGTYSRPKELLSKHGLGAVNKYNVGLKPGDISCGLIDFFKGNAIDIFIKKDLVLIIKKLRELGFSDKSIDNVIPKLNLAQSIEPLMKEAIVKIKV